MIRRRLIIACAVLLVAVGYGAFRVGQVVAARDGMRNLAFVSLLAVEPALRVSEFEAEKPGQLPRSLAVSAEDSILIVARYSMVFDPNLDSIAPTQRNVLCVIAKYRERHRAFYAPSQVYDNDLMSHLEKIYKATAKDAADSTVTGGRVACSLPAGGDGNR